MSISYPITVWFTNIHLFLNYRLKQYLQNKKDKQKEREEKRKKKIEKLKEVPKHYFEDKSYAEQRDKREKDIYDSVDKGIYIFCAKLYVI